MSNFLLRLTDSGYELSDRGSRRKPLVIDFNAGRMRRRIREGGREMLARAVGAGPGRFVVDCTAGLGTDSFVLAARGCEVLMVERSHTLYLMLEDALRRAADAASTRQVAARITLVRGDAGLVLSRLDRVPDAVTIDPMFPARKKAAAVRGSLQLLQQLVGTDEDVRALLQAARSAGCRRIVVKRPLRGGELAGMQPDRVAPDRVAPDRVAPDRVTPDRVTPDRVTPDRVVRGRASRLDIYTG